MTTNNPVKTPPPLVAFHGKKSVKAKYLRRVAQHRKADELRQGYGYWQPDAHGHFRGCAVGCTLHSRNHAAYETELGIPAALAHLEDRLFERVPATQAMDWPTKFLEAIPVGADLSLVTAEFMLWLLDGVLRFARPDGKVAIEKVAALYRRRIAGDEPMIAEWRAAAEAAEAAAEAARWAAEAAAEPARWAAEAEAAAARWAAEAAFWITASEKLLEILRSRERAAPVRGKRVKAA